MPHGASAAGVGVLNPKEPKTLAGLELQQELPAGPPPVPARYAVFKGLAVYLDLPSTQKNRIAS